MEEQNLKRFSDFNAPDSRTTFNIGGTKFEILSASLNKLPEAKVANLQQEISQVDNGGREEFYFDRNPEAFSAIANFYRTGALYMPKNLYGKEFKDELEFWGIDPDLIEECSLDQYQSSLKEDPKRESLAESFSRIRTKENVGNLVSGFLVLVLMFVKAVETMRLFIWIQGTLIFLFLALFIEILLRFIYSSNRRRHMCQIINVLDLVGFLFLGLGIGLVFRTHRPDRNDPFMYHLASCLWLCRCFRLMWLMRMSNFCLAFSYTFRNGCRDIASLFASFFVIAFILSTLVWYCEKNSPHTRFVFILESFWFVCVTMTTVGYGDMLPYTGPGKCVAVFCAITGVFFYASVASVVLKWVTEYHSVGKYKKTKESQSCCCFV